MNKKELWCRAFGHKLPPLWGSSPILVCKFCGKRIESPLQEIARAMSAPFKVPLNYKGIGRKLLMVKKLKKKPTTSHK